MRRKWFTVETSYSDWVSSERISVVHACLEGGGEESWCGCAPCGPFQPARGGEFLSPSPALMESHPETETLDIKGVRSSMRVADTDTVRGSKYTAFISGLTTSEVKALTGSLIQTLYIQEKLQMGSIKESLSASMRGSISRLVTDCCSTSKGHYFQQQGHFQQKTQQRPGAG